jgi:hypothetical protein
MSVAVKNAGATSALAASNDRRYFAELMVEIESRMDVNAVRFEDVVLWPLVRWQLARGIKGVESASASARRGQVKKRLDATVRRAVPGSDAGEIRRRNLWSRVMARMQGIVRGAAGRGASAKDDEARVRAALRADLARQFADLRNVGNVDFVVFSKTEKYYQKVGDARYAPVTDPVYEDMQRYGRALAVALEPLDFECVNPPLRLDIEPHMWLTRRDPPPRVEGLVEWSTELNGILNAIAPEFHLNPEKLISRLQRYCRKRVFFREVISILHPRAVFFSSFTGWAPLTWACRQMGVPTVDIQHGGQGPYHYLTTHFTRVPDDGYALLPDYFWCWSHANRDFIRPWFPGRARRHEPLVGGNRNVAKWLTVGDKLLSEEERAYVAQLRQRPKVVLVTLGYAVEDILPEALVEAARSTPEWHWLFRLHPLHRDPAAVEAVQGKLRSGGVNGFEIAMPTQVRLHAILSAVDHHLTPFSTTCREAAAFGVPTTIVDPVGRTYFSDEIDQGIFGYADEPETIVAALEATGTRNCADRRPYLETDDALVDRLVERILHDHPASTRI